jgi:hypothetical protein
MTAHVLDSSLGGWFPPLPGRAANPHTRKADRKTQLTARSTAAAHLASSPVPSPAEAAQGACAATGCEPSRYEPSALSGAEEDDAGGGGAGAGECC